MASTIIHVGVHEAKTQLSRRDSCLRLEGRASATRSEYSAAAMAAGFSFLPIDQHHARLAGELPLLHRDPFDRMLVAQAMIEQLPIVSRDAIIARYGVPVLW